MNKLILATRIRDFFFSSQSLKTAGFVLFTVLMTAVIASQNFFFQTIVENGISKKDVVAQKTITVVDVKRTEQHKKEVAQKVEPILAPAEDDLLNQTLIHLKILLFKFGVKMLLMPLNWKNCRCYLIFQMKAERIL